MIERFRNIFRSSLQARMTLLDQMMVSGSNFLLGIILTRSLGLEKYGAFALAWMGILLVSNLQQALILKPMMTLGNQEPQRTVYYAGCFRFQLLFSVLAGMIGWGILMIPGLFSYQETFATAFPVLIVLFSVQEFWRRLAFMEGNIFNALIIDAIAYLGTICCLGIFYLKESLTLSMSCWILVICFAVASLVGALMRSIWLSPAQSMGVIFQKHWSFGSWLVYTSFLQFFSGNYFVLAAAALLGTTAVGALRIAQNLIGLTHVLFLTMENTIPIRAAQAFKTGGIPEMRTYFKLVSLKTGSIVFFILMGIAATAPWLIELFYGKEFVIYTYLLQAYVVLYFFIFPGYLLRFALRTLSYTQPIFFAYIASTLFGILAATSMIKSFDMMGVVYGLIIAQILMHLCYGWLLFKRIRQLNC